MLVKLVPEDFVVEELTDWEPSERGAVSVYELTKRKLDTFEAMRLVSAHCGVPLQKIAYIGLKDRQGVTTQLISIDGGRLDGKLHGLHYKYLGRAKAPLSAANLRGNKFTIVVRDLGEDDLARVQERRARIERHGIIGYFDDQRFGSLAAGQGMPGRDLVRGDFEAVVRALIATPGHRDPLPDKKFKFLVSKAWGDWELLLKKWGTRKGVSIVQHLRRKPGDYRGALQKLPAKERAIHVFAYQSYIWNESVARYLAKKLPPKQLSRTRYVAGELVWPELSAKEELPPLVETFPLLDDQVEVADPDVRAAVDEALAAEGLTQATFKIDGIPGCFFGHHERPLRYWPGELVVHKAEPDDRRPGRLKVRLSFSLPPGVYATLVLQRLFGDQARDAEAPRRQKRKRREDDDDRPRRDGPPRGTGALRRRSGPPCHDAPVGGPSPAGGSGGPAEPRRESPARQKRREKRAARGIRGEDA